LGATALAEFEPQSDGQLFLVSDFFLLMGPTPMPLNLSQLQRVDDFTVGQGVGDHHQPGACVAPLAAFVIGEGVAI
jgi:hypothetical protein